MTNDLCGAGRLVIADVVNCARPRPGDRGAQHARQIIDMDPREDLARLVDMPRRARAQRIEWAAGGAVNAGETKDMNGEVPVAAQAEPSDLGGDATRATLAGRL
jgi:hypothetical protein